MTPKPKKKKFKAVIDDSEKGAYWEIWDSEFIYRYAEFYGKWSRTYARSHAKMLNALPAEEQP